MKSIFSTPDCDVVEEFQIPLEVIAEFNENSAVGRIWDVRIEDEQSKSNVNSDDRIGHVLSPLGFFGGVLRDERKARLGADRAVQVLKDI